MFFFNQVISSSINENDGHLDFSQSTVLYLNNPLRLYGQGAYNVSQLHNILQCKVINSM